MTDHVQPKRRGRPPKPAEERKGSNLTFRTRSDFRDRLEQAAAQSGRSVTEEVELRVERSFEVDRVVRRLDELSSVFLDNGPDALSFVTKLMASISSIQEFKSESGDRVGSQDWSSSAATSAGVRAATLSLLDHFAPEIDLSNFTEKYPGQLKDIRKAKALAELWARMATGRADDVIELVMRQNGTSN